MKYVKTFENIRNKYAEVGVSNYYTNNKHSYINPHEDRIQKCLDILISKINIGYFLDLGCGNGEVSKYLSTKGLNDFKGCDPYFKDIYEANLEKDCYDLSFEDISKNGLPEQFDTIICSYSIHLCENTYFNNLLYQLSRCCKNLVVISPSKYPIIDSYFELGYSAIIDRTHLRIFKSIK